MDCSMPGFPVHYQLQEPTQTHVHQVSDAIQPSHPLSSPSPSAFNVSQPQSPSGESPLLSRSGGEKGLRGSGAGTLGVPLEETRRVGGLLGVAGRLSGTVSPFRAEQGTSLETPWCGGILELRRGSQPSPWVGPGKPNLPLGLRGKAGGCARVTARPKRPHLGVCPGPNIPLQGRQGSRRAWRPDFPGAAREAP